MTHSHREFRPEPFPLAYLISFRAYGTWLHGDKRGSIDRFHNRYGSPHLPPNEQWRKYNQASLKQPPVKLDHQRRQIVEKAIKETCKIRRWELLALNVRTNHVQCVVSAFRKPEPVLNALKANATRELRETGCWNSARSPWALKGSTRYLWDEEAVTEAVVYVTYEQGLPLD